MWCVVFVHCVDRAALNVMLGGLSVFTIHSTPVLSHHLKQGHVLKEELLHGGAVYLY